MQFRYNDGASTKYGRMTVIHADFPLEADIEADGWNFHIIVGKHTNGKYICIPNWNVGSELAELNDSFWNSERLRNYTDLNESNSAMIAAALAELSRII